MLFCFRPFGIAVHGRVGPGDFLVTEAPNLDCDAFSKRLAEVLHVHTGSAVDVRRIFLAEERDLVHLLAFLSGVTAYSAQASEVAGHLRPVKVGFADSRQGSAASGAPA